MVFDAFFLKKFQHSTWHARSARCRHSECKCRPRSHLFRLRRRAPRRRCGGGDVPRMLLLAQLDDEARRRLQVLDAVLRLVKVRLHALHLLHHLHAREGARSSTQTREGGVGASGEGTRSTCAQAGGWVRVRGGGASARKQRGAQRGGGSARKSGGVPVMREVSCATCVSRKACARACLPLCIQCRAPFRGHRRAW